ncbi:MAG: glycerol-3-phosphate 1-O-acyltransferase PlsY [Elusimicrobiota bacterium]|jgi:glycerol-3-phosphate acyltransferase PlsY|nr:glycerol-3-phosphate 1-O-acyltransferase PlsY [Elusimicrobiota bacterium]
MMTKIILLAASYLLGAIPSGYIITKKLKGFDIRDHGSGNPGAANVFRVVGKWPGVATFVCDALKGAAVVLAAKCLLPGDIYIPMLCGFIAICAHMWTIFLKLRGGKGVATSAGVFGALLPAPTALAFLVFAVIVWRTGRISPGSIAAAVVLPVASYFIGSNPAPYCVLAAVVGAMVIYKHIPNIKRMLHKEELKFEDGSKKNEDK